MATDELVPVESTLLKTCHQIIPRCTDTDNEPDIMTGIDR